MSAEVKLSTKLPGDPEINGLDSIAGQLIDTPDELRTAIVQYDVVKVIHDTDSDSHVPTVRIRRIEDIGTLSQVPESVRSAFQEAGSKRLGRRVAPFEMGAVVEGFDPDQPELGGE